MSRWISGEIVKLHQWSDELYSIFIKAEVEPFIAGQFTQIGLGEEERPLFRPYSFVNAPEDPILEFYFNLIPQGALTEKLVALKPSDPIWVARKASGRFTAVSLDPASYLWCFATGTGLGVFLSILKTHEPWEKFDKVFLVHSVPTAQFQSHHPLIQSFKENHPDQFQFIPIVTRETVPHTFQERMTTMIETQTLEKQLGLEISSQTSQVMLCGNPHMVQEMRALFQARGMNIRIPNKGGQVTIESYWKD